MKFLKNSLYYGDCLDILVEWPPQSIDLCYLDPPFNSHRNYNLLFDQQTPTQNDKEAQILAFVDTWIWDDIAKTRVQDISNAAMHPANKVISGLYHILGPSSMMAYLSYMADRLVQIKRVMKDDGSVYLHCDPHASHYLKLVMDGVFGATNFRNEIIWRIGWVSGYKTQKKGWIRNHDTILFYTLSKGAQDKFNKEYLPYPEGYTRRDGSKPTGVGIPIEDTWNCSVGDRLDSIMIKSFSREKLGYDTQKPLDLLRRIIKASSRHGDTILDPFCGCGTTVVAARELERSFVGIDISPFAIDLVCARLKDPSIVINGVPTDMIGAKRMVVENALDFEKWAVSRIAGLVPNKKQVGDGGSDGQGRTIMGELVLAQVKGGMFQLGSFRDFLNVVNRENAQFGVFITLEPVFSKSAKSEAASYGRVKIGADEYDRIQLWSISDYFDKRFVKLPTMADPYTGKAMDIQDLFETTDTN